MAEKRVGLLSPIVNAIGMLVVVSLIFFIGYVKGADRINGEYEKMFKEKFYGIGVGTVLSLYPPGIVVSDVYPGTPAEKAGLQKFDVILSINFREATSERLKTEAESGGPVRLEVRRRSQVLQMLILPELMKREVVVIPVK